MYGFIYNTLRKLVIEKYGENIWKDICDEADLEVVKENIVIRNYYDESILKTVGTIAARKLGVSLEDILESFGAFFFHECKRSGHSSMLRTLGHNLYGFLMNLDSLHDHLSFTYTQMRAPSFRCEKTRSGLILHYYSQRPGLSSIVVGIVKEVAKDFFNLDLEMKVLLYEQTTEKLSHHYKFQIGVKDESDESYLERLTGEISVPQPPLGLLSPVEDDREMTFEPTPLLLSYQAPLQFPVPLASTVVPVGTRTNSEGCPISSRSQSTGQMIADADLLAELARRDSQPVVNCDVQAPEIDNKEVDEIRKQLVSRAVEMPYPLLPSLSFSRAQSRRGSAIPTEYSEWPITPNVFQNCFPFHIIFDRDLVIRYMGISLARLFPKATATEAQLTDYFELSRPAMKLTYSNIRASIHNIFIINTKKPVSSANKSAPFKEALQFRGQMIPTSSREGTPILFLASPRVSSIKELEHQGLYLSDIPIHDVTRDLILLNRHFQVEMSIARELEETKHDLQIQKDRVDEEKKRADELLHAMLPKSVANDLKSGVEARAIQYPEVTILFSDIRGFTVICSKSKPMQVVGMLSNLYTLFDSLLEKHNVYKVETIGDAYMVAAGLLDTASNHAEAITNMAFDMRDEANKVMEPVNNQPLQIRIGIHTGPVVAGVVGIKMPRYCLFGDTVNTASRMESHGEPGYVHISGATYSLLQGKPYVPYSRGKISIKGLGERQTYFIEPASKGMADPPSKVILVEPESRQNAKTSVTSQGSAVSQVLELEPFSRSASFVKYDEIKIVKSHGDAVGDDKALSPNSSATGLVMKKPSQASLTSPQMARLRSPSPLLGSHPAVYPGQNGVVRKTTNVTESAVDIEEEEESSEDNSRSENTPPPSTLHSAKHTTEQSPPALAVRNNKTAPINHSAKGDDNQTQGALIDIPLPDDGRASRTSMNSSAAIFISKSTDVSTENIAEGVARESNSSPGSTESKQKKRKGRCIIS